MRNFEKKDIQRILALYKYSLGKHAHFVRDESFLSYLMHFPGVTNDSIFVAELDHEIVGFAVVSITYEKGAKVGLILEIQCKNYQSFNSLIRAIESYCINQMVDAIALTSPLYMNYSFTLKGWLRVESGVMMVKGVDLLPLLEVVFSKSGMLDFIRKRIILQIDEQTFELSSEGVRKIEKNIDSQVFTKISLSSKTLLNIIFNRRNPFIECIIGRIKPMNLRGVLNLPFVLKILSKLRLSNDIYISLSDRV